MAPKNEVYWFIFQRNVLLLEKNQSSYPFITEQTAEHFKNDIYQQHYLGEYQNTAIFCAEINPDSQIPNDIDVFPFRKSLDKIGVEWFSIAVRAYSILHWNNTYRYCGKCGRETLLKKGAFERYCSYCLLTFYPRISPSIIVLIQKNNQILMARSHHFAKGSYALIAGFVEVGESLEEAVHREVKEEVGITIKNLRYFNSQPWPFPDSLMIGFFADYDSGDLVINHDEIEEAGWYDIDHLPGRPSSSISIANQMIEYFLKQQMMNKKG